MSNAGVPDAAAARLHAGHQRLYVNIDHVATLRQARRGDEPDPLEAALLCQDVGADGITAHLREDRRHVQDADVERIAREVRTVLNFEMAATEEMVALAERLRPHAVTLVPAPRLTQRGDVVDVHVQALVRRAVAGATVGRDAGVGHGRQGGRCLDARA